MICEHLIELLYRKILKIQFKKKRKTNRCVDGYHRELKRTAPACIINLIARIIRRIH